MIGFTKCLSREAATFGVRVNAIAAGIFETELAEALPERLLAMHDFWAAAGRKGRPEELAEMAAFLVSERNSFMNGEVVIVDGGAIT
jgi:3-oxoacyl-[acyl-carrier protein] reductase